MDKKSSAELRCAVKYRVIYLFVSYSALPGKSETGTLRSCHLIRASFLTPFVHYCDTVAGIEFMI